MQPITHIISEQEDGLLVRQVLLSRLKLSQTLLRRLKHTPGGITLDGQSVTVRAVCHTGQSLCILSDARRTAGQQGNIVPVAGALDIVFEDAHLLVLNKPSGIAVHPSHGHVCDTLGNRVAHYLQQKGEWEGLHPVHRIDRGTSGLVCLAKTHFAASRLGAQLSVHTMRRAYVALVCGHPSPPQGTLSLPIAQPDPRRLLRVVRDDGAPAVTHYRTLLRGTDCALLHLRLETGRTHQIRVHMAHIGHPVLGDFLYGTEFSAQTGHALHAARLHFAHPIDGRPLSLRAPLPRWYSAHLQGKK